MLAAATAAAALFAARPARADDAPPESGGNPVEAQMRKVAQLMRENEEALLEASRGARAVPKAVDVPPPPAEPAAAAKAAEPPKETAPGTPPRPDAGKQTARSMDDLLSGASQRGHKVRQEIEALLRMIPH